jgi:hypothetical protein
MYFLLPESAHGDLWRWAVGFGAVPALVVMAVRHRYMEESASWAARKGHLAHAVEILRRSYGVDAVLADDAVTTQPDKPRLSLDGFRRLVSPRYRRRTILAGVVGSMQSAQYYAVGFFLPFIIGEFLGQGVLTTIAAPMAFNFVFGVVGGFLGVLMTNRLGSWRLATYGFSACFVVLVVLGVLGEPTGTVPVLLVGLLLGVFMFSHSFGPGAQGMTMATLSYPTSLRGTGAGFGQAVLRVGSTMALVLFPILTDELGTGVFFVVAIAPLTALVALLAIRWEPVGQDVDADDFEDADRPPEPVPA